MPETTHEEIVDAASGVEEQEYVSKRGRRILTALIAVLIIILLITTALLFFLLRPAGTPSQDDLGGVTWIRSIYGYGPDISQMIEPAAVAVDVDGGDIWVTDQGDLRVVKFDASSGDYLEEIVGGDPQNPTGFIYPSSIDIAPDGWMYIAESTYDRVRAYDADGVLQYTLDVPSPLSVTANNEMVLVGGQGGFAAYDREGQLIGIVGERGTGPEQFDGVNGVALDDENNAYVVDSFNNRISKFDAEGFLVWETETGAPGNQSMGERPDSDDLAELREQYPALMQVPMGATLDAAGRLIVIDLLDFSIAAFDTEDGAFLGKWGTYGEDDGRFAYPGDIDYDPEYDWFVVADTGNRRAQIIRLPDSGASAESALRRTLAGPLRACGFPLLVLLIMIVVWVLIRNRRKRNAEVTVAEQDVLTDLDVDPQPSAE